MAKFYKIIEPMQMQFLHRVSTSAHFNNLKNLKTQKKHQVGSLKKPRFKNQNPVKLVWLGFFYK